MGGSFSYRYSMDNVNTLSYNDYEAGMGMLQVRIDSDLKNRASDLFNEMGIDLSTAVRIFLIKCLAVGGLPFEMNINSNTVKALSALERMGEKSKELGNDKMTLDEINKVIEETRKESK